MSHTHGCVIDRSIVYGMMLKIFENITFGTLDGTQWSVSGAQWQNLALV